MTNAEILQSKIDHAHLRAELYGLVRRNTPSRISMPYKGALKGMQSVFVAMLIEDFANNSCMALDP